MSNESQENDRSTYTFLITDNSLQIKQQIELQKKFVEKNINKNAAKIPKEVGLKTTPGTQSKI